MPNETAHDMERLLATSGLPREVQHTIATVAARSGLRGAELADVVEELVAHFRDGLASGREVGELLLAFGDKGLAAHLIAQTKHPRTARRGAVGGLRKRGDSWLLAIRRNMRYAIRRLLQSPGFTVTAVLSLALGIGANTAIFTVVNAVLLRELPLRAPEELVDFFISDPDFPYNVFSYPDFEDLRDATADVFTGVAATRPTLTQVDRGGDIEMVFAEAVSGNYFPLLGVPARLGRTFGPEDDVAPGSHPVVMLSYGYWQRAFGGRAEAVGEELRVSGRPYTVVGVVPEEYSGSFRGLNPDIYAPYMMINELEAGTSDQLRSRANHSTWVKGRLKPGGTMEQARVSVAALASRLREESTWNAGEEIRMVPSEDVVVFPPMDRFVRASAWLLMGVVGLVLFIACTNLASFLLARALDRRKEIAVRLALGATRRTLIGQLLTETMLLGLLGGAAGVAVGALLTQALVRADLPLPLPVTLDLSLDATVLGFSLAVALGAGLVFGLIPAVQGTRADVAAALRDESAGAGRPGRLTLRNALVVAQVAGSLVLLVSAGLFVRNLQAAQAVDPGFGRDPAAILSLVVPATRYDEEEGRLFQRALFERIRQLPGVAAVGLTANLHLNKLSTNTTNFTVDGVENPPGRDYQLADYAEVDSGFFDAAGIQIVRGRNFRESDDANAPEVVIVNQALADRFWPGQDPVGRQLRRPSGDWEVVGVATTAKIRALTEAPRPFVYRPYSQRYTGYFTVVARTEVDPEQTVRAMVGAARALDPEAWVWEAKTMDEHLAVLLVPARLSAILLSGFAGLALTIACIGLYGIVSYAVSRRTREVGIRMSLGADGGTVVRLLMSSGVRLVAIGGAVGLGLALLVARAIRGLLLGVDSFDPVTFAVVPLVLVGTAVLAAYIPARRASRVNPVRALKTE